MAEKQAATSEKFYRCAAGFTVGMSVCAEGEVLTEAAFGFSDENKPLDRATQILKFGRVMYEEYTPDEEDLSAIRGESARVAAMVGMQHPDMPPVVNIPQVMAQGENLHNLSRAELRVRGRAMGLHFPEDMDRDKMIGALEKRLKKAQDEIDAEIHDGAQADVVKAHRENATKVISESNAAIASGGSGGGRSRKAAAEAAKPAEVDDEEEEEEEVKP